MHEPAKHIGVYRVCACVLIHISLCIRRGSSLQLQPEATGSQIERGDAVDIAEGLGQQTEDPNFCCAEGSRAKPRTEHGSGTKVEVVPEGLGPCDAGDIDMSELALQVCFLQRGGEENGYDKWGLMNWTLSGSLVSAVYSDKEKHCVLAFSGNVLGFDDLFHLRIRKMYYDLYKPLGEESSLRAVCGRTVHGAFYDQFVEHMSSDGWKKINKMLMSDSCSAGIRVIGSSLGGAAAEIVGECARNGRLRELQGDSLPAFNISGQTIFSGVGIVREGADSTYRTYSAGRQFIISNDFTYDVANAFDVTFPKDTILMTAGGLFGNTFSWRRERASPPVHRSFPIRFLKAVLSFIRAIFTGFKFHHMETYVEAMKQTCFPA